MPLTRIAPKPLFDIKMQMQIMTSIDVHMYAAAYIIQDGSTSGVQFDLEHSGLRPFGVTKIFCCDHVEDLQGAWERHLDEPEITRLGSDVEDV